MTMTDKIELIPDPAADMISVAELLMLGVENRIGRIADASEQIVALTAKGLTNIEGLTAQIHRLADAFESMAGTLAAVTDLTEGKDGVVRGFIRHDRTTNGLLAFRGSDD